MLVFIGKLVEYYQMSTHVPGFQSFLLVYASYHFVLDKLATNSIRVKPSIVGPFSPFAAGGQFGKYKMLHKTLEITETLANGYSSESTQHKRLNEYQHDSVWIVFKDFCILVSWTKGTSALEGLRVLWYWMGYYALMCTLSRDRVFRGTPW